MNAPSNRDDAIENTRIITNYELRITNYELRITNYELRITNYELRITNSMHARIGEAESACALGVFRAKARNSERL